MYIQKPENTSHKKPIKKNLYIKKYHSDEIKTEFFLNIKIRD